MSQLDRRRLSHRVVAVIGAAALALMGAVTLTTAASAVPGNMPTGNGTLTLHKFEQPAGTTPDATGNPITVPGTWTPMNGVPFTIQRITTIDLTTNAGWNLANTVDPNSIPAGDLGPDQGGVTAGAGTIGPITLPIGAYLVKETPVAGSDIVKMAEPFVVTIPLPDAATKGWITDVHVYPKNSVGSAEKSTTAPGSYGLGNTVTWPIDVVIPTLASGDTFTSFSITDNIDPNLGYEGYTMTVDGADVSANATVTEPTETTGGTFSADFMVPGSTFLTDNAGKTIHLVLTTKVVTIGTGNISNVANVKINDYTFTPDSYTKWGDVKLKKVDNGSPARDLEGAKFQVFGSCNAQGEGVGTAISVTSGGTTLSTFESDSNGIVHIAGLYVGNETDGQISKAYCVVETEAPAGYNLSTPAHWNVTVEPGATTGFDLPPIVNPQKPPVDLPLTGAAGTAAFTIGGLALMLMAGGAVLLANRRKQHQRAEH